MADLLSHEQKENVAEITVSSAIKDRKCCGDVAVCRTPLSSLSSQINISQSAKVWHESSYCTEASVPVKLDLVTQCSNTDVADFTDLFIDHAGKEVSSHSEEMQQSISQNSSSDQQAETSEQNEPEAEAGCSCTDIPDEHLSTLEVLKEDSQPHTDDFLLNKLANEFVLNVIINAACKLVIESKSSTNDTTSTTMSCQKKEKETPFKKYSPCKVLNQEGAKKCTDYLLQPLKFCYMEGENLLDVNEMKDVHHDSNMDMFLSLGHCQSSTTLETSISDALDVNEIDELQSSNVTKKRSVVAAAAFSSQRLTTPAGYRCRSKRSLTVHSQPESLSSNLCPKLTTVNKAIQVENMETSVGVTCAEWQKAEVVSASTSPIVILEPRLAKLKNIEEEKAQLLTRCLQSEQQVKDLEFQLQKFNSKIPSIRTSKDSQLNGSKKKIDSLEAKILQQKKTIAELQAANRAHKSENSYKELQKAKGEKKKWNAKFTEERAKLESVIGNLEQKSRQAEKQVALLNKKTADLENANQDMAGRFKETDEELKELKLKYKNECQGKEEQLKLLQTECESLKQELDDAKHALENREQEINVLQEEKKRMMESINYQQVAIAKLRKDCKQMAVIQNEMIDIQEQMKKMEISAAETQEFLEQERTALKDELMEKEEMVTELNYSVLQLTEENNALKDLVAQMKQQYTELAEDLNQTKAHAHTLLLQGNAELTVSGIAANKLLGHLYDFYDELTEHWNEECQREGAISKDQSQQMARESIVSTVMQSIKKQFPNRKSENAEESEETKKDEDSNESLIVMEDELEVSGIKPLTGADNSIMTADVASSSDSSNSDSSNSDNLSLDEQKTIADKNIEPLNKQIEDIDLIAQTTVKLFRNLYKLIKDHVLKLESEIQKIECNAAQEKRSLKALVNSLNKEIEQKCEREKSLHDELLQASKQIEQKDKEINDAQQLIMERTERMETLAEQLRTAKKQEKDIMKISTLLKEKDRELFVIKQTLSTDLEKIAQKYGSIATYPIKEIVHLRKENASLHDANVQLQREKEAICEKLSKRIEVYKSNWTLADAEVARLDRLIEKIRQALFTELESLQTFTQLQPILCELELINPGLDSQSA